MNTLGANEENTEVSNLFNKDSILNSKTPQTDIFSSKTDKDPTFIDKESFKPIKENSLKLPKTKPDKPVKKFNLIVEGNFVEKVAIDERMIPHFNALPSSHSGYIKLKEDSGKHNIRVFTKDGKSKADTTILLNKDIKILLNNWNQLEIKPIHFRK